LLKVSFGNPFLMRKTGPTVSMVPRPIRLTKRMMESVLRYLFLHSPLNRLTSSQNDFSSYYSSGLVSYVPKISHTTIEIPSKANIYHFKKWLQIGMIPALEKGYRCRQRSGIDLKTSLN
jgi:hypothetical protein